MIDDRFRNSHLALVGWLEKQHVPDDMAIHQALCFRIVMRVFPQIYMRVLAPRVSVKEQQKSLILQTWRYLLIQLISMADSNLILIEQEQHSGRASWDASDSFIDAAKSLRENYISAQGNQVVRFTDIDQSTDNVLEIARKAYDVCAAARLTSARHESSIRPVIDSAVSSLVDNPDVEMTLALRGALGDFQGALGADILLSKNHRVQDFAFLSLWDPTNSGGVGTVGNLPDLFHDILGTFKDIEKDLGAEFRLIVDWYLAFLHGLSQENSNYWLGGDTKILALQPNEFWTIGPNRTADQILVEAAAILGERTRFPVETKNEKSLAQFIVDYLEEEDTPRTIDDVRGALEANAFGFVDSSLRRDLGQLTNEGRIRRLEKGLYRRMAEMERDEDQIISEQRPAAFQFHLRDNKISAIVPAADPSDHEIASELLTEAILKASELLARLRQSNAHHRVISSIEKLLLILPDDVAGINAGLLRSRARSIESDSSAFAKSADELFPDAISMMTDLSETLKDLQGCFVAIRSLEAEVLALDLVGKDIDQVKAGLDQIVYAIKDTDNIADDTALDALDAMQEIVSEAGDPRVVEKRTADYALVVRNAASALVSHTKRYVIDAAGSVRKGSLTGLEKGAEATVRASFVLAVGKIAGPLYGLGLLIVSFVPIWKSANEVNRDDDRDGDDTSIGV